MIREELNKLIPYSNVKIDKGTFKGKTGIFLGFTEKFITVKIKDAAILFPIEEYIEFIFIV